MSNVNLGMYYIDVINVFPRQWGKLKRHEVSLMV